MAKHHRGMEDALVDTIATMVQALRMGQSAKAREAGVTTLAVWANRRGRSVDQVLAHADPHPGSATSGERARVECDAVAAEDRFEVLDAAHGPSGRLVRATNLV